MRQRLFRHPWLLGIVALVAALAGVVLLRRPAEIGLGRGQPAYDLAFSPDGRTLYAATEAGLRRWSWPGRRALPPLGGAAGAYDAVAPSPDGRFLAARQSRTATAPPVLRLWRLGDGAALPVAGGAFEFSNLAWSPDGPLLAVMSGPAVQLWRVGESGASRERVLTGERERLWDVAFSPDGQTVAAADGGRVLRWQVGDGDALPPLTFNAAWVCALAFSPDGRLLAGAGSPDDGRSAGIWLWQLPEGTPPRGLAGHRDWVNTVAFSPDGRYLASAAGSSQSGTAARDNTVRLWRVADGAPVRTLEGRAGVEGIWQWIWPTPIAYRVLFSPDGRTLLVAVGGSIHLWQVP